MKKRMPLIIAAAALLLFSGLFLFLYFYNDTLRFHHMTEEFFAEAFRQDSLSLHYTLAEPSDYLQKPSPATLPLYSRQSRQEAAAALENQLLILQEINPERLNQQDRYTWSLLVPYLENELAAPAVNTMKNPLPRPPECSRSFPSCWPNIPSAPKRIWRITWRFWKAYLLSGKPCPI